MKRASAARVDLGGIAKGYAIDRAAALLQSAGLSGGVVDVGGDMKCFGQPPDGSAWEMDIKDPFEEGAMAVLQLGGGAVCTSGNYARFSVIEGKSYSHIVDPRSGRPAEAIPSVTVVAPDALTADVWATALSVLGEEGLALLPEGVDALMIVGPQNAYQLLCTAGFAGMLPQPLPGRLRIWKKAHADEAEVGAVP
jgi:thiamine biosynthesis lipoprotein